MTPLLDALVRRATGRKIRFHMPGHMGGGADTFFGDLGPLMALDMTELRDTGDLYRDPPGEGPIRQAEALMAQAAGAPGCHFLTGGATQGIFTMLAVHTRPGDTVVVDRGCHYSVYHAMALLGLRPVYLYGARIQPFGIPAGTDAAELEACLAAHPQAKAVLVTCPTYQGVLSDIPRLAALCHDAGLPLLVDAAHGAHLPWLPGGACPIAQGAAMCVCSAHKTLPALGQAAYLLFGRETAHERVYTYAGMTGSASPSYLLMASLDAARDSMERAGRARLAAAADFARRLRQSHPRALLSEAAGVRLDPTRLCLHSAHGVRDAAVLEEKHGVVCEMADESTIVFILTAAHEPEALRRLEAALADWAQTAKRNETAPEIVPYPWPKAAADCAPRAAMLGARRRVPLAECEGKTAACPVYLYPPGVPLVTPGERFDKKHLEMLDQLGYNSLEITDGKGYP